MAGKLRRELKNRLRVLLAHLLKWQAQPKRAPAALGSDHRRAARSIEAWRSPEPPAEPGRDCRACIRARFDWPRSRPGWHAAFPPKLPYAAAQILGDDLAGRGLDRAAWAKPLIGLATAARARERVTAHRGRQPAAAHRPGAALAVRRMVRLAREVLAHLVAEYGRGSAAPAVGPVLVPGVRLRARLRLALERRHHHGVRRAQGGGAGPSGGLRPVRRRRQGRGRRAGRRPRSRRLRGSGARASSWSRPAGSPPKWTTPRCRTATSCTTTLRVHAVRQLVRGAAGHVGCTRTARRYHWLSEGLASFVDEPHAAVCCDARGAQLNMVASGERRGARRRDRAGRATAAGAALAVRARAQPVCPPAIRVARRRDPGRLHKVLLRTYEQPPEDFASLLGTAGLGPKSLRALALTAEVIYGTARARAIRRASRSPTAARTARPIRSTGRPTTRRSTCCTRR